MARNTAPERWPCAPAAGDIRKARKQARLSQVDAAALIYRRGRTWQDWEGGRRRMDPALWEYWRALAGLEW